MSNTTQINDEAVGTAKGSVGRLQETLERIALSRQVAQHLQKELKGADTTLNDAALLLLGQKAFDVVVKEDPDLRTLVALLSLVLRFKQQALAERKFDWLTGKKGAKGQRGTGGITPEALRQIEEMAHLL